MRIDFTGLDIVEGVTDAEGEALANLAESVAHEGMLLVEVGSWKGFSTAYLASVAKAHHGLVLAVDHWRGNAGGWNEPIAKNNDILAIFRHNMRALGVEDVVIPCVGESSEACQFVGDSNIDMIFIDADHRATPFGKDLSIWLPKLKQGGILSGHDCEFKFSMLSPPEQHVVLAHVEEDCVEGKHCGIIWTLFQVFGDKHDKIPGTHLWCWHDNE